MAKTISFARGAPSLDIIDVDGLKAAAANVALGELMVDKAFSDYVERTGKDYEQHYRAPWTRSPDD